MSKKLFGKFFIFLLVVGLLFAAAPTGQAQAASNDNNVEWDGTGHNPSTTVCTSPVLKYRDPVQTNGTESLVIRARSYPLDLTGINLWYTTNLAASAQTDWSSVPMTYEIDCGSTYAVWKVTLPAATSPLYYKFEYIDGTKIVWRNAAGEGADGMSDTTAWTITPSSFLYIVPTNDLVSPANLQNWYFTDDGYPGGSYSFVGGPGTAPLGIGSVKLAVTGTARQTISTSAFTNVRLADISKLSYSTFVEAQPDPSVGLALNIDIDYDGLDDFHSWTGRLIYEPYMTTGQSITVGAWQTWDTLAGKWWASSAPGDTVCPQASPCDWSTVLTTWPNATASYALHIKAGGPADGLIAYADKLEISLTSGNSYAFNFEPIAEVFVDNDFTETTPGWGVTHFATVKEGISAVAAGGTVNVADGTYAESLTITKPLTLLGPNAGIDGTTGTRNPEALITFPEGDNTFLSLIDAESDNITINGFSFTNNQINNGDNSDTYSGHWDLILVGENIEFVNNRVISQATRKIPFKIQGPFTNSSDPANNYDGAVVKNNYFESPNTSWNTVIVQGIGATVQYNSIIGGTSGIQIQPYTNTADGIVSHNNIAGYVHAIWHNYQIDGNGLWIYDNNILGAPIPLTTYYYYGKGTYWQGIVVQTHTPNIEVRNNTINGENGDYTLNTGDLYERTSLGVSYYSGLYQESQIYVHDNEFVNVDQNVENQTPALGNLDEVFANNTFERSAYVENSYLIYTSIQDAIAAASDGDMILVGPGTYDESLVIDVPNLTIKSTDGAATTIIDVPYTEGVKTTGVKVSGTDLGVVTFDGFTVKNFTENGIIQGTASASGTSFHVLNNTVLPFVPESGVPYLRDGIQVSGDGSTVKGNYVEGGYLTPEWGSTGILVVNASNVLVEGNIISGELYGLDMGIDVLNWGGTTVSNITITGNTITGADYPFSIETHGLPVYDVTISHNIVTDYLEAIWAGTWGDEGTEPTNVDASGNYWGSEYGPQSYVTGVTLTNWAIDDNFTVFAPEDGKITLTSDNSQVGAIKIYVPGISYYLTPGTVLQNSSPCFEVYANDAHIYTDYPAAAKCVPTEGSDGIWVADGVENLRVVNLEFDGTGQTTGDGIHFEGVVTNFQIINNYFHDLGGDAIEFVGAPAGTIQDVYGNYFVGTNSITLGAGTLNAAYNSWGTYVAPTAPASVTVAPHTHAEIYVTPAVGGEVLKDSEVVFTVNGKIQSLTGAEFELSYPTAQLELVSAVANETTWDQYALVDTSVAGKITVALSAKAAVSGDPVEMLTLTFKALAYADDLTLTFSETADVFAMYPLPEPNYSNHVYTFAQTGVTDLDIIGLPVVTITMGPEPYYAGIPIPFEVEVDNTNGGTYTGLTFNIDLPVGSVLEYFDGTNWVTVTLPFDVGNLSPDQILTLQFRVTLDQPGDNTIAIDLMDGTELIGSDSVTITISGNFNVLGTFAMQGRTIRSGIPVIFTLDAYAPEFATVDQLLNNLSATLQYGGTYLITTNQPRYLNVTADLHKNIDVYGDVTLEPLTLRAGNAIWTDNIIDVNDASKVTDNWGVTVDTDADVNFDLKVNIQDLALVGGNMDLTSADAYGDWDPVLPVPAP